MALPQLIIDFDSTFVSLESLDELANIALEGHPKRAEIMQKLSNITDMGMTGQIGFAESLVRRMGMFELERWHIEQLVELLRKNITPSVQANLDFFRTEAERIYIISGGFSDYIVPVVADYGLAADHVLANWFEFDEAGKVTGYDQGCPLAHDNGKAEQLAVMHLSRPVYMIGDGFTDYQVKAAGEAGKFFAFTENVARPNVIELADEVLTGFDQLVSLMANEI